MSLAEPVLSHCRRIFSRRGQYKLRLLVSEQWLLLRSRLTRLVSRARERSKPPDITPVEPARRWLVSETVSLPEELISRSAVRYSQDKVTTPGEITTSLEYRFFDLPHGRLVSNATTHVSIFSAESNYLRSCSYRKYFKSRSVSPHYPVSYRLDGVSACLYGNVEHASGNYGHWLIDGVAQVFLLRQCFDDNAIDHYLVPTLLHDFQFDTLKLFGIDRTRIVEVAALECVECARLLCTTAPRGDSSNICPRWLIEEFRNVVYPVGSAHKGRRIYISRRDAGGRHFDNEAELETLLERYGFSIVTLSEHEFREKIILFSDAEFVIGMTGAGMANLIFCSPGTSIMELHPAGFVNYLYASICQHLGLDYRYLILESDVGSTGMNRYYGSFTLPVSRLEASLQKWLG